MPDPAPRKTLATFPAAQRLAIGLFALSLLGFYALAQVQLAYAVGGGEALPGPEKVLIQFHGDRTKSRFHKVLDPRLAENDSKNMGKYLVLQDPARAEERRKTLLDWAAAGAPASGWGHVGPILTAEDGCAKCHSKKPKPDDPLSFRDRYDMPFDTPEEAASAAGVDTGMSPGALAETSHNHAFGFAIAALVSSVLLTLTRWRGPLVPALIVAATAGAVLDIASWWLTHAHGSPWEHGVILGGALFGLSILAMNVLVLDEALLAGRLGAVLSKVTGALRLGRRDPV